MKRLVLCLTTILLLTGCETSTNPLDGLLGGGGGAITAAQATGNWSFTLSRTSTLACSPPALASGVVISAHLDVLSDGTVATTSSWLNPISSVVEPLSGSLDLTNGGITRLLFATSGSAAMELVPGTMTSSGTVTGTLTDPAAGLSPVFASDGCQYSVSGVKT